MMLRILLYGLLLAGSVPALAATVRVQVVDEDGAPVERARVSVQRVDDGAQGQRYRHRFFRATTDGSGRAVLRDLEQGEFLVHARGNDPVFVDARENPLAEPVKLTLEEPDQVVDIRLELHRGTHYCVRFVIDGSRRDASGTVVRQELENRHSARQRVAREEESCGQLFAGRWEMRLEPPRGYVLVDLDVNGFSQPGHVATLDVRRGSPSQYVTWYLAALAHIDGRIHFRGERFGVTVVAELLQGGSWQPAADQRGGSLYAPVYARPDETGYYSMDLPDGQWRLSIVGDGLEETEPPELELTLARGERRSRNFEVRGKSGTLGAGLRVSVLQPGGDRAVGAVVELWPPDPNDRGDEPLARERLDRSYFVYFRDLPAGAYRLVAGHPDFMENARDIEFDPEKDDLRTQNIRLRRAAELKVRLQEEERPEGDLRIELSRVGEELETELGDETLLSRLRRPRAELDATNRARVRGIYPGKYMVRGVGAEVFVELQVDGRWKESADLVFSAGERREMEARLVQAGRISGSLFCAGGEPLPSNVDLRVIATGGRPSDPLDTGWVYYGVLQRDLLLQGEHRDRFAAAPLDPGSYLVTVRPATFDRWTWAPGVENGFDAQSLEVIGGAEVKLGTLSLECGPAIYVTLQLPGDAPAPSLDGVRLHRGLELTATVVTTDDLRYEIDRPTVESHPRLLVLRGFPEGRVDGTVALSHRYFVPHATVAVPLEGELERGKTLTIAVPVEAVGGVLELVDPGGATTHGRAVDLHGGVRIEPAINGRIRFENLPVGQFRFDFCADERCDRVLKTVEQEIRPLETIELER